MIGVTEAKSKLFKAVKPLDAVKISVKDSPGYILYEDIYSPVNLPLFDNSAVDGYAIRSKDCTGRKEIKIIGEVKAGKKSVLKINKGTAVRLFTGAMVPKYFDTVVMKEDTYEKNHYVRIRGRIIKGSNIRKKGGEIANGDLAFNRGTLITPPVIGSLSSMGVSSVRVFRKPKIAVIVTGSELVNPGEKLSHSQIYDSNSLSLYACLRQMNIERISLSRVNDNFDATKKVFRRVLRTHDVIIFSGGVSAGKYDFVIKLFQNSKIRQLFYKVAQKPGKPLYAGKKKGSIIFGLPGNPAATMVCFYEYVYPVIRIMQGSPIRNAELKSIKLPVYHNNIPITGNKALFLKGKVFKNYVKILKGQGSSIISSFAGADCLIYIPERLRNLKHGYKLELQLLPH